MKSNLAKKIADTGEDLIPVTPVISDMEPEKNKPIATEVTKTAEWLKNIEKNTPASLLMKINTYMMRLKKIFLDTPESLNQVAITIIGVGDDPFMEEVLLHFQEINIHPGTYLLTRFIETTPEAQKYIGINSISQETLQQISDTVPQLTPTADKETLPAINPDIATPAQEKGLNLRKIAGQVLGLIGRSFRLNIDFMALADNPANIMDLEALLSKETVGRIDPPSSGFFNEGLLLPNINGSRRIDFPDENRPHKLIQNISAEAIDLKPGEIEVEMPFSRRDIVPLPTNYEMVAVVGDKPLEIIEPDERQPLLTYMAQPFVGKKLHMIIRRRQVDLNVDFETFKPSEEERATSAKFLPLPEEISKNPPQNMDATIEALKDFMSKEYLYVCDPRLGKFIGNHHAEVGKVINGLKVGHCSILSWVAANYLRQLGFNAIVVNSMCTNDEGSAFRKIGHARVALKDDDGTIRLFDPTMSCKVVKGIGLSDIPDQAFNALEKEFAKAKTDQEKHRILNDFRKAHIDKSPKWAGVQPDVGAPVDQSEMHDEFKKLAEIISERMPELELESKKILSIGHPYDSYDGGSRESKLRRFEDSEKLEFIRKAKRRLTLINGILNDPLNCSLSDKDIEDIGVPRENKPLTFDVLGGSHLAQLIHAERGWKPTSMWDRSFYYKNLNMEVTYDRDSSWRGMEFAYGSTKYYSKENIRLACQERLNQEHLPNLESLMRVPRYWVEFFKDDKFNILSDAKSGAAAYAQLEFMRLLACALNTSARRSADYYKYSMERADNLQYLRWPDQTSAVTAILMALGRSGICSSGEEAEKKLKNALDEVFRFLQPYLWAKSSRKEIDNPQAQRQLLMKAAKSFGVGKIKHRFFLPEREKEDSLRSFRTFLSKLHLKQGTPAMDETDAEYVEYDPNQHDSRDIDQRRSLNAGKHMVKVIRIKTGPKRLHVFFDADAVAPQSNEVFDLYGRFRTALEALAQYSRLKKVKVYVTSSRLEYLELDPAWSGDQLDLIAMWLCRGDHQKPEIPSVKTAKGNPKNLLFLSNSEGNINSFKYALKGKTNLIAKSFYVVGLRVFPRLKKQHQTDTGLDK